MDSEVAPRTSDEAKNTACPRIPVPFMWARQRTGTQISFTDTYGYRGADPALYYLSPWEFTKWWRREPLHDPGWYHQRCRLPWTEWTESGLIYKAQMKEDPHLPAPKAGIHYVVSEPFGSDSHIVFPDLSATKLVRHRFVLVRQTRPYVPQPIKTPLLRKNMDLDERGRILSVYLRPWTLVPDQATPHVPYLLDLDIVLTSVLSHRKRYRGKQVGAAIPLVQRSFADSWDDYRRQHIVSKHAMKLIRNFVLT